MPVVGALVPPVVLHAAVTMTDILGHLDASGRLTGDIRQACITYLRTYGTAPARSWAEAAA